MSILSLKGLAKTQPMGYIGQSFESVDFRFAEVPPYEQSAQHKKRKKEKKAKKRKQEKAEQQFQEAASLNYLPPSPLILLENEESGSGDDGSEGSAGSIETSSCDSSSEREGGAARNNGTKERKMKKKTNISDDSEEDELTPNQVLSERRAKKQMSKSFKRVTEAHRVVHKLVRKKDERRYEAFSEEFVCNKKDEVVQDLLVHSENQERRLKRLAELKKAKKELLEAQIKFEAMVNQPKGKQVNQAFVKKKEEFEEEVLRQKERQLAREKAALTSKLMKLINKQVKQVEPISEREWRKLVGMNNTIPDFEPMQSVSMERIQKSMMEGLPASLRGEIWCIVCHVKREKQMHAQDIYSKLLDLDNPEEEHRIQKDVTRTFSNYPVSGQECDQDASWNNQIGQQMLFNVLLAYANYDSQIGYVQGLNYIAAMLLMHIQEEENVFWCLIYLLNRKNWRRIYMEEMPKLMDLMDYIE